MRPISAVQYEFTDPVMTAQYALVYRTSYFSPDAAGHRKPDDLLGPVVDDEVPGRLQPHGAAGGSSHEQTLGTGALVPPGLCESSV